MLVPITTGTTTATAVHCDGCDGQAVLRCSGTSSWSTPTAALLALRTDGWVMAAGATVCPDCLCESAGHEYGTHPQTCARCLAFLVGPIGRAA